MSDEQKATLTKAELQEKVEQLASIVEGLAKDSQALRESMLKIEGGITELKGHINIGRGGIVRKGPVDLQLSELDNK